MNTGAPKLYLDVAGGRRVVMTGAFVSSKKDFMTLKVTGESLAVRDVFDKLVVFEGAAWVDAPAGAKSEDAVDVALPEEPDFEYGVSAVARSRGAGAAKARRKAAPKARESFK